MSMCIYCGGPKGIHDACPALSNGQPCSFPRGGRKAMARTKRTRKVAA